jgi:hypothetical protein
VSTFESGSHIAPVEVQRVLSAARQSQADIQKAMLGHPEMLTGIAALLEE